MSWEEVLKNEEDMTEDVKPQQEVTFEEFEWAVKAADHSLMIYFDRGGKEIPEKYSYIYTGLAFYDHEDAYDLLKANGIKIIKNTRASEWKNYDGD